jgi:hypothetical protein
MHTPPGLRNRLKTSGNVHAVAEQVPGTHHHVADVHSNTEADTAVWRDAGVRIGQGGLRLDRALHGVHRASELRKDTVAAVFAMRPLCSPMILSRIARRSVSPLSVPTSSVPMRRL